MATRPELTESEILKKMRDHVGEHQAAAVDIPPPAPAPSRPGYDLRRLRHDVEIVSSLAREVAAIGPRPAGLKNKAIRFAKKVMRSPLSWLIRSVHQFNAGVVRALEEQVHALESMQQQIDAAAALQSTEIESMQQLQSTRIKSMQQHIDTGLALQSTQIARLDANLDELRKLRIEERLRSSELKLRRWESPQTPPALIPPQRANAHGQTATAPAMDFDYFLFEEYHRGSEQLIRDRQRTYLKAL